MKSVFISYSWDSENHKEWVLNLANRLEEYDEIHVVLDQYDLDNFSDKNQFMEEGVFESEIVLVVSTEGYVEKANKRRGGVGIESKMSSSRHWEESVRTGKSNIVVLKRNGDFIPNYLKEKLYVDFSNDDKFEIALTETLKLIKDEVKVKRPAKKFTLKQNIQLKDFTRSEDIIKLNHKKRKLLFEKEARIDFSGNKKIKFELWETQSPRLDYYLILFENTNLKDTVDRVCLLMKKTYLKVSELTVLRPSLGSKSYLEKLFLDNLIPIKLTEITYSHYVWEYCIHEEAKRADAVYENPFFIDQSLVIQDDDVSIDLGPASDFIKKEFSQEHQSAAVIILAPGGMGKTTLCQHLANHFQNIGNGAVVFIQSETIKNSSYSNLIENSAIESIYDLYEVYAKICSAETSDVFYYDEITFEVSLLSGNLTVIIDGIDELISIFPDNFNLEKFINSIVALNKQLGNGKILLTSRNDIFSGDILLDKDEIKKVTLLGFDKQTCVKYLEKRFRKYPNSANYIELVMKNVSQMLLSEENEHVLPFFIDLISRLVEESNGVSVDFDLSFNEKKYESNTELIDCLVYSVLRREYKRQDLEISIESVVALIQEIVSSHGDKFPVSALEEQVAIYYSEFSGSLSRKILLNPLLVVKNDICKFKYDFLGDYFTALYIIDAINHSFIDDKFIAFLARYAYGDKSGTKEVSKYYSSRPEILLSSCQKIISGIIPKISERAAFENNDLFYRAISSLVHLIAGLPASQGSKEAITSQIKEAFSQSDKLKYFSVYGELQPLDFTNIEVWYSKFVNYKNFLPSKFGQSKFYYSYFEGINQLHISPSFDTEMFDSCRLGDLEIVITQTNEKKANSRATIEKEVGKFLSSFFNRGAFKDQKVKYIKFSDKVKTISIKFLETLLKDGVISVKVEKSDETYYEINPKYHQSVHNFINNNVIDSNIDRILDFANK